MGAWGTTVVACLCAGLAGGCAVEGDVAEAPHAQLAIEGASFSLGQALAVDNGALAVLNVDVGACETFLSGSAPATLGDEEPLLLGFFAEGNAGIAAVDGDDPRLYVTSNAVDDRVAIDEVDDGTVRATVHLTFDRAVRTEWIGIDWVIVETPVQPPVVLDYSLVATPCR